MTFPQRRQRKALTLSHLIDQAGCYGVNPANVLVTVNNAPVWPHQVEAAVGGPMAVMVIDIQPEWRGDDE